MKRMIPLFSLMFVALACGGGGGVSDETHLHYESGTGVVNVTLTCNGRELSKPTPAEFGTVDNEDVKPRLSAGTPCTVVCSGPSGFAVDNCNPNIILPGDEEEGRTRTIVLTLTPVTQNPGNPGGDVDLGPPTTKADTARVDLKTACDALTSAINGFVAIPRTHPLSTLNASKGACAGQKDLALAASTTLSQGLTQASATNTGRAAAQAALDSLNAEIAKAATALNRAEDELRKDAIRRVQWPGAVMFTCKNTQGSLLEGCTFTHNDHSYNDGLRTCVTRQDGTCTVEYLPLYEGMVFTAARSGYTTNLQVQVSALQDPTPWSMTVPLGVTCTIGDMQWRDFFLPVGGNPVNLADTAFECQASGWQPIGATDGAVYSIVDGGTAVTLTNETLTRGSVAGCSRIRVTINGHTADAMVRAPDTSGAPATCPRP